MPRNANKRRCVSPGCGAWAVKGGDLCSAHARLNTGAGAPAGNVNHLTHGLYSRHFTDEEIALMLAPVEDLADEIALCRVLTSRVLSASKTAKGDELVALSTLALRSASTVARLLRANQVITGQAGDDLAGAIGAVLDQLGAEYGVKL